MLRNLRRLSRDGAYVLSLVVLVALRYYLSLPNFWLDDDSQILKHAISYQPWGYFFVPEIWQNLSAVNFTPWVSFSFDIDWLIFGLNPRGFYAHQLISLCLLSSISFIVLRLWFPQGVSFAGALLISISVPFAEATQFLMMRHYVEGFVFALLSVYCFVKAVRADNGLTQYLGAFFYLLAVSAKEIYVPLVFLLLLLPDASLKRRLRSGIPWFFISVVYVFWRSYMLNRMGAIEGYGNRLTWPHDAFLFFPRLADAMIGEAGNYWSFFVGFSVLSSLFLILMRAKKAALLSCVGAVLVLLPVVPVSAGMSQRLVLLPLFCWIIIHVLAWDRLLAKIRSPLSRSFIFGWIIVVLSAFLYVSNHHLSVMKNSIYRKGLEGRFVFEKGKSSDILINPIQYGHSYSGLLWLRHSVLNLPAGPAVTYDPRIICSEVSPEPAHLAEIMKYEKAWYFDTSRNGLIAEGIKEFCAKERINGIRMDMPLSLDFGYKNSVITWKFGPYTDGAYAVLLGVTGSEIYPLPAQGRRFKAYKGQTVRFRLRYESPEGWTTYSPLLTMVITEADSGHIHWERGLNEPI